MKKKLVPLLIGFLSAYGLFAQTVTDDPAVTAKPSFETCVDAGLGYIPKADYKNVTLSGTVNNFYLKRFGATTLLEIDSKNPAFLLGPTYSIKSFLYIFAQMDFFTSRGVFNNGIDGARKDVGLGFYPKPWAAVKLAYSFSAGPRAEIGVRFPIQSKLTEP